MKSKTEKEKLISEEVEKTLKALDNLPLLEANPFLLTRITARLAEGDKPLKYSLLKKLRPVAFILIVVINIVTAVHFFSKNEVDYSKDMLINSLSEEYNIVQNEY